jgi:hypothetical protein
MKYHFDQNLEVFSIDINEPFTNNKREAKIKAKQLASKKKKAVKVWLTEEAIHAKKWQRIRIRETTEVVC